MSSFTKSYSGDPSNARTDYVLRHSLRLHPAQEKLIEATKKQPRHRMLSSTEQIQLLQNLARLINARKTLDIGIWYLAYKGPAYAGCVYTGYSALSVALILPEDGTVVACDISEEYANVGKPFWKEAGVDQKIDLRIGPAVETLREYLKHGAIPISRIFQRAFMTRRVTGSRAGSNHVEGESLLDKGEKGTYDFAYIDADKQTIISYYEKSLELVRSGGIIAVDNVLWGGSVYDESNNEKDTVLIRKLNDLIHKDQRVHASLLDIGDGVNVVFKK